MPELDFQKKLVPRLPQNTSNVSIKSTGKSKQCSNQGYDQYVLEFLIYLHFIILKLISFD